MNYITLSQAAHILGLSYCTFRRIMLSKFFKDPIRIGGRSKFYEKEYIESLIGHPSIQKKAAGRPRTLTPKRDLSGIPKSVLYKSLVDCIDTIGQHYESLMMPETHTSLHDLIKKTTFIWAHEPRLQKYNLQEKVEIHESNK